MKKAVKKSSESTNVLGPFMNLFRFTEKEKKDVPGDGKSKESYISGTNMKSAQNQRPYPGRKFK